MSVKIFAGSSSNVYDNANYAALDEVNSGFQPNTPASSMLANSVLKLLTNIGNAVTKNSNAVIGPSSTEQQVKDAVKFMNYKSYDGSMSGTSFHMSYDKMSYGYVCFNLSGHMSHTSSSGTISISLNFGAPSSSLEVFNNGAIELNYAGVTPPAGGSFLCFVKVDAIDSTMYDITVRACCPNGTSTVMADRHIIIATGLTMIAFDLNISTGVGISTGSWHAVTNVDDYNAFIGAA